MYNKLLLVICVLAFSANIYAQDTEETFTEEQLEQIRLIDSINKSMKYTTRDVILRDVATMHVPENFKFLGEEQSKQVVTDIWGNPEDENIIGMLFPADGDAIAANSYAFIITYEAIGYVKDEDADDIDYDEMLKESQDGEPELNKEREKMGFEPIHFVGWAQKPYYDKEKKVLHWAKEFHFGDADYNTLNYDIRILGREGILSLNAVADMSQLGMVKENINAVLDMPKFIPGKQYKDFDHSIDKVAAYTIGGLVAGKVLAKAGFFVLILKFWKIIAAGIAVAFAGIRKFFKRKKEEEAYMADNNYIDPLTIPAPADESSTDNDTDKQS
ncbi:MAG: DUF2167 domain-containing protein [Chitinophagaceae bacterium]|nr:DUF2167 domain-containing protein [Chitinophagaceae bacterium]MCB9045654.1 DUF2167 domain-containing protein [Chitinophagales bacterium]